MTPTRSTIDPANLQEILDASATSVKQTLQKNKAQYFTPAWFAHLMAGLLPKGRSVVFDPQCGRRTLLETAAEYNSLQIGVELDQRLHFPAADLSLHLTASCVDVWRLLDEFFPDLTFRCQVANPPFGLKWAGPNGPVDSTQFTWDQLMRRAGSDGVGYMIANRATIDRLGLYNHPSVYLYQTFPVGIFPAEVEIGVLHFSGECQASQKCTLNHAQADEAYVRAICTRYDVEELRYYAGGSDRAEVLDAFRHVQRLLAEERRQIPPFNVYLDAQGYLRTYLSTRQELTRKFTKADVEKLAKVSKSHPATLTTERDTRLLLQELVTTGVYTIQPAAKAAIDKALADFTDIAIPIRPVTDFQATAYADENEALRAKVSGTQADEGRDSIRLTAGRRYPIETGTYAFTDAYQRQRLHLTSGTGGRTYVEDHDMTLSGQDRFIALTDDDGTRHRFLDRPDPNRLTDHSDSLLWRLFERPEVPTVAEKFPAIVAKNRAILDACELLAGFEYYPGQRDFLARLAVRDYALCGAATGTGKTLMAISLIALKAPARALIVAPQGTTRGRPSDDEDEVEELQASQWITELRRFAPGLPVFELFGLGDYERILSLNHGQLPHGVYVSYYEAMFQNGARETGTDSFTDEKLYRLLGMTVPEGGESGLADSVGTERHGIRCIARPCLATLIGHHFDLVALDEAHKAQKLSSNVTQMIIRLQPRYRYALTATPIPNLVTDLFPIMGWLCVPGWYLGGVRNAAWPYARNEGYRFSTTFLTTERDLTQEELNREEDSKWRGRCETQSPVVSSPSRLLKLITPTMAYISKEECNPKKPACTVHDLRVPMGAAQARLYGYYMERAHIPERNPRIRAAKQVAILRDLCAAPGSSDWNRIPDRLVHSNFNPKTAAILQKVADILDAGDQVVIVSSRLKQTDYLQRRLASAGVPMARIDSSLPPERHTEQANLFKRGRAAVMLMGIKCAQAHSFDQCPHLIVASLEYSYGSFCQAGGRIDRVTSRRPMHIWCVLHQNSIEEIMFDIVATKGDAATICLRGQRVPRDFKPVDLGEVLARNFAALAGTSLANLPEESAVEQGWPVLEACLRRAVAKHPCQLARAA